MRNFILFILAFSMILLSGCKNNTSSSVSQSNAKSPCAGKDISVVGFKYDYEGELGAYGIADNAFAFALLDTLTLVARAHATEMEEISGGVYIFVEEEHINSLGEVTYKGQLMFKPGFEYASLVEEKVISGKKCFTAFTSWPCFQGF